MYKQFINEKQQIYSITFITCIIIVSVSTIYVFFRKYQKQRKLLTDITDNYNALHDLTHKMQKENDLKINKINILEAENREEEEQFLYK